MNSLVRTNLLRPFTGLRASPRQERRSSVEMLGILTCDRSALLAPALADAAQQLGQLSRDMAVVVVDGSRRPQLQAANRRFGARLILPHRGRYKAGQRV